MAKSLHDLFVLELQDAYHAERQLTKALPKMAKAAHSDELSEIFEAHLHETEGQIQRLEHIFELLDLPTKGKPCEAMRGLIEEASELLHEDLAPEVLDAALVSAAQRVEHYEISSYGTLRAFAEALGHDDIVEIIEETLEEEHGADEKLNQLAESEINHRAADADLDTNARSRGGQSRGSRARNDRQQPVARDGNGQRDRGAAYARGSNDAQSRLQQTSRTTPARDAKSRNAGSRTEERTPARSTSRESRTQQPSRTGSRSRLRDAAE